MPRAETVAGVDEAGRGALAGPVVAGACILPKARRPSLIRDSKTLSESRRDEAFEWIRTRCVYGYGIVEASVVDEIGILKATERAMREAVVMLSNRARPDSLLVDGRDAFTFDVPHRSVIRGDATVACIAAASIVAKVVRDKLMIDRCARHPAYGFSRHKGYGTTAHFEAVEREGPCDLHRIGFLTKRFPHLQVDSSSAVPSTRTKQGSVKNASA